MPLNQVSTAGEYNIAIGKGSFNPGKIRGFMLHKKGVDLLTTSEITGRDLKTPLQADMQAALYKDRVFMLGFFDNIEDNGEGVAYETREQFKYKTEKGTWDKVFTITGNFADYWQMDEFVNGKAGRYNAALIYEVDNGYVLGGKKTATGFIGFAIHALEVLPMTDASTGAVTKYMVRLALKYIEDVSRPYHVELLDSNFEFFNVFDDVSGLLGVEQCTLTADGSTGNGIHDFYVLGAGEEENIVANYPDTDEFVQDDSLIFLLGNGTEVSQTGVATVSVNGAVAKIRCTLDQTDYTNGAICYVSIRTSAAITNIGRALASKPIAITLVK